MKANGKDICISEAKGVEKVAKAEADAMYGTVKERCDALAGVPKDTCQNDAKVKFGMK